MDRLIAANSVPQAQADTAPTTGTAQFATDGNPATNVPATRWPSYQYNAIQEELIAVLTAAGITPDRTNNAQITAAIQSLIQGSAQYKQMQRFTSSGTFTVPAGVYRVKVRVWGGGGGGAGMGNSAAGGGGGGGGGGYSEGYFATTPGASISVTVGAGGTAGNTSTYNGGAGGTSSVTGMNSASGGGGGTGFASGTGGGGVGGSGSGTGAFNFTGSTGQNGVTVSSAFLGGLGGGSFSVPSTYNSGSTGPTGNFPGGGAGGGTQNTTGGAGGAGQVIFEW